MTAKYRSKVRDEPRILRPLSFSKARNSLPSSKSGIFYYSSKSPTFTSIFDLASKANKRRIKINYGADIERARNFIDLQYRLASEYAWLFDSPAGAKISEVNTVYLGAFTRG